MGDEPRATVAAQSSDGSIAELAVLREQRKPIAFSVMLLEFNCLES